MDVHVAMPAGEQDLLARLKPGLVTLERDAEAHDRDAVFAPDALASLRDTGALVAPFPPELGGMGLGTMPSGAFGLLATLRHIGRASLSLGRVYEGHVNGVRLVFRYGTTEQMRRMAVDAVAGHVSAIWAAENPREPLALHGGVLHGRKAFASGVGVVTRPVLTVRHEGAEQLVIARLAPGLAGEQVFDLHGVRSAATASIRLDGVEIGADQMIGGPGDYMRQPEISLGAWRPLAVMLGGFDALVDVLRKDLRRRGRTGDPHQRARFGRVVMLRETASLWVNHVAFLAEAREGEPAAAQVKLARIAFEDAVTEAIQLAQRTIGMPGFVRPHAVERLSRDLATYLRQPAPDMVLDEAAGFYLGEDEE